MRMKRTTELFLGAWISILAGILCGAVTPAQASCRIQNVSLERAGKFTKITVYADGPFEFSHATEEAKDGKPYRVIIDCKDALFGLPQNNFTEGLPVGTIRGIRTSQFEVVPERIVRVVLDVEGPVVYKVLDNKGKNKASIAILTAGDPDFSMWTAATVEGGGKRGTKTEDTGEKITAKQQASSPGKTGPSSGTAKAPNVISSPDKLASGEASKAKYTTKTTTVAVKPQAGQPAAVRKKISRSPVPLGPFPEEVKVAQETREDKAETAKGSEDMVSTSAVPAETKKTKTPSVSSSGSKQNLVQRAPRRRRIILSAAPPGPYPEESVVSEAMTQPAVAQTENVAKEATGTIAEGIGKILGPESVVAKETQLLPESLMVAQESGQIELELVPQRKVVQYNPGTKRDPFVPLTDKRDMSFGAAPLPLFESLKLVGILRDDHGNRALLEDQMGFGYILTAGDRIKDGHVISVDDEKATFQVEEYGGYQIMVLELNQEY